MLEIFDKGYAPNWSEELFLINKSKILFHRFKLLTILMVEKVLEFAMEKNCKRLTKKNL